MCFKSPKIPDPKPAPPPPSPNKARLEAIEEERRQLSLRQGRASTLISGLSDEDVAGSSRKKKLGGE